MVDVADQTPAPGPAGADTETLPPRRSFPSWLITIISAALVLLAWGLRRPLLNPIFGPYPSAIAVAFWKMAGSGKLTAALVDSLRPFAVGYVLAVVIGAPLGVLL